MITYTNIVRHDLEFEAYLKMPGYSHSFLKKEFNGLAPGVDVTDNMRVGSMCDSILTEPHRVKISDPLYQPCKIIASLVRQKFPIENFERQVSYTADVQYKGYTMLTKSRLDFLLPNYAVIDLKITTAKPAQFQTLIDFMGYENQVWHYAHSAGVTKAYLIMYSRPVRNAFLIAIDVAKPFNSFWADKIEKFGTINDAA